MPKLLLFCKESDANPGSVSEAFLAGHPDVRRGLEDAVDSM